MTTIEDIQSTVGIHSFTACTKCGDSKSATEFPPDARKTNGLSSWCRECNALDRRERRLRDPEGFARHQRQYRLQNYERALGYSRKARLKTFGLTVEQYDEMLEAQGGGCAICGEDCPTSRSLCVDHDHATGVVRGLLCIRCNVALGALQDDPFLIRKAADYVEVSR